MGLGVRLLALRTRAEKRSRHCHNPIFTPQEFLGCRHAKRGSPNQVGPIQRGLATSNILKKDSGAHFPKFDQVWPRLTKFNQGWPSLIGVDQVWSRFDQAVSDPIGVRYTQKPSKRGRDTFPRVRRALTKFDQGLTEPLTRLRFDTLQVKNGRETRELWTKLWKTIQYLAKFC